MLSAGYYSMLSVSILVFSSFSWLKTYTVGYSTPSEFFLKKYMIQCVYINLCDVLCKIVFHLYLNSPSVGSSWVHRPMWFGSLRKLSIYHVWWQIGRIPIPTASRFWHIPNSQAYLTINHNNLSIYNPEWQREKNIMHVVLVCNCWKLIPFICEDKRLMTLS